jgi:DNA-binding MarR family transcriptional regulator
MINRKKIIEDLLQNMHAMRHKFMVGYTAKKDFVITPSQGFVLRFVAKNSSTNVKAIADSLHITSSAATQLIDGLVDNGYLVRSSDLRDRRIIALALSDRANKFFKEFKEQGMLKMTELFDVLTDQELTQYAGLNQKIISNIMDKEVKCHLNQTARNKS